MTTPGDSGFVRDDGPPRDDGSKPLPLRYADPRYEAGTVAVPPWAWPDAPGPFQLDEQGRRLSGPPDGFGFLPGDGGS